MIHLEPTNKATCNGIFVIVKLVNEKKLRYNVSRIKWLLIIIDLSEQTGTLQSLVVTDASCPPH